MHKLSDKFGSVTLHELRRLPKAIREAIMDEYEVRSMEDLPEEGHIVIQVPIKDESKVEALKARIADVMNIDEDSVDVDEGRSGRYLYAEMVIGSGDTPWPVFAYDLFKNVDEAVHGLGHRAEAIF